MSYGIATVTVPILASTLVGEKSAAGTTEKFDPNKHFTIQRLDTLSAPAFLARVRAATAGAKPNDVLVYVHGYLNDFNAALFRAAQLKHDLEFPGLVVVYSWPSQGTAAGYTLDEANVEWSAHNFRKFLDNLTASTGTARVHVLAHSMGNRRWPRRCASASASAAPASCTMSFSPHRTSTPRCSGASDPGAQRLGATRDPVRFGRRQGAAGLARGARLRARRRNAHRRAAHRYRGHLRPRREVVRVVSLLLRRGQARAARHQATAAARLPAQRPWTRRTLHARRRLLGIQKE